MSQVTLYSQGTSTELLPPKIIQGTSVKDYAFQWACGACPLQQWASGARGVGRDLIAYVKGLFKIDIDMFGKGERENKLGLIELLQYLIHNEGAAAEAYVPDQWTNPKRLTFIFKGILETVTNSFLETPQKARGTGLITPTRTVEDINKGLCADFATAVYDDCKAEGFEIRILSDEDMGSECYTHTFIGFDKLFYDAECHEGTSDWKELPSFQRMANRADSYSFPASKLNTIEADTQIGNKLIELLDLKVKENGRVDTSGGDKTPLGLALTVKRLIEEG